MPIEDVTDAFFGNVPDADLFVFCASGKEFAIWGETNAADVEIA
jgi:hypothetical protein